MLNFEVLTGEKQREDLVSEVLAYFTTELDGLALVFEKFNYDQCMDLIKVISNVGITKLDNSNFWPILVGIFGEKANKR